MSDKPITELIKDLPFSDYLALPHLQASQIVKGLVSMKHMRDSMAHQSEQTTAMAEGTMQHAAVFEWDRFAASVAIWDGRKAGKEWQAFKDDNEDGIIMTREQFARLGRGRTELMKHRECAELLASDQTEMTLTWEDRIYGGGKCRFDSLQPWGFIDLKNTSAATPSAFFRQAYNLAYHVKVGWYAHGYERHFGKRPMVKLVVLAYNKGSDTFDPAVLPVPDEIVKAGEEQAVEIATRFRACCVTQSWPGMWEYGQVFEISAWAGGDAGETDASDGEMEASNL